MEKVKVLLINPSLSQKDRYSGLSGAGSFTEPLGLCYLASYLRKLGTPVAIIDDLPQGYDTGAVVREVLRAKPEIVGFTATTLSINKAASIAEKIKTANGNITMLIGGQHITSLPEDTMKRFWSFDIGVIGEGEIALAELVEALSGRKDLDKVDGIIFRDGGAIRRTAPRKLINDLDILPVPAWDLVGAFRHKYRYRPSIISLNRLPSLSVMFSRGCLGSCSFCSNAVYGRTYRAHSPRYFIEVLKYLKRHGVRDLSFQDPCFGWDPSRAAALCELMIKTSLGMTWNCQSRVDILDERLLKLMKAAGCWQIKFGIESYAPDVLRNINKKISPEDVSRAIGISRKCGIRSAGYFIIGNPGETKKNILDMIRCSNLSGMDDFKLNYLTPYPGGEFYTQASEHGIFHDDWQKMNEREIVFIPRTLKEEDMKKLYKRAYLRFYLRPGIIINHLRWLKSARNIFYVLCGVLSMALHFAVKRLGPRAEKAG